MKKEIHFNIDSEIKDLPDNVLDYLNFVKNEVDVNKQYFITIQNSKETENKGKCLVQLGGKPSVFFRFFEAQKDDEPILKLFKESLIKIIQSGIHADSYLLNRMYCDLIQILSSKTKHAGFFISDYSDKKEDSKPLFWSTDDKEELTQVFKKLLKEHPTFKDVLIDAVTKYNIEKK